MLRRVSAEELEEWLIYMRIEPFGPQALNINFGMLLSLLANVNRRKGQAAITWQEVALGVFDEDQPKQSQSQMKSFMNGLVEATKNKEKEDVKPGRKGRKDKRG